jgi:hypothetical protein
MQLARSSPGYSERTRWLEMARHWMEWAEAEEKKEQPPQ